MAKLTRLTPEIRADFVAYLDGELDEQTAERIESVLAHNTIARNDVDLLAQTYDLLDVLPRYEASEDFAEQTMATIRISELKPDLRETEGYRLFKRGLLVLAATVALMAVIAASYLGGHRWIITDSDLLLRDLPVIEQLDVYSDVHSVEFLQRLANDGQLIDEMMSEAQNAGGTR